MTKKAMIIGIKSQDGAYLVRLLLEKGMMCMVARTEGVRMWLLGG